MLSRQYPHSEEHSVESRVPEAFNEDRCDCARILESKITITLRNGTIVAAEYHEARADYNSWRERMGRYLADEFSG